MITSLVLAAVALSHSPLASWEEPDLAAVEARGVQILLAMQENYELSEPRRGMKGTEVEGAGEPGREWPYEGVYREARRIPPGYRVGGTSICALALLESRDYTADPKVAEAVERGLDFVLEHLDIEAMGPGFSGGYDVRGWGHTYALEFMLRLRALKAVPEVRADDVDERITWLVDVIMDSQLAGKTGGWNYSHRGDGGPASPFMTGPTLLALWEAQAQGETLVDKVVERALDALENCRLKDGSIPYTSAGKGSFMDQRPGAMGRMAITEVVLLHAGRSKPERVEDAIKCFFEHWDQLEVRRRQNGTHIQPYGVAPYYVFYAHRYVAQAIEHLPKRLRKKYRTLFLERIFSNQEESGGWNDRVFPRSENYGTAMALLALRQPDLPALAGPKTAVRKR
ncbi:MAG: hypothetical protein ACI8QC_001007 [Planctomycetota bacterium]|jgi:hypothetical protein